jgi:hypothetical protein
MNTKELRDKIGTSSFNAIVKHPYYKEHLASSYHDPVFHHETTSSGSHSTIKADVPFGGKKKTITFQYHKNRVYNAHYALDGKHIKSHKDVNEDRYQDKPIHRLLGTTSLTKIYKKDTPGQNMKDIQELSSKVIQSYLNKIKAKKRAEQQPAPVSEAKIGDKVQVTGGSQKGIVGHVGEIRKGVAKGDHTYTVDYEEDGKRQSVQVKKAHTKSIKEASIYSSAMSGRGQTGMRAKAPNASDMASYGTYSVTVKHSEGEKTYKLKNMKDSKHAQNTAMKIHRKDNPSHKIDTTSADKLNEENITEISKKVMGRYIEKAATSMATAAFGQGQSSASRQPPREQDQKTGMKRMTGIARATSKLTKEEAEQVDELKKSTMQSYLDKTVDYDLGMPKDTKKPAQRIKGIERASKKILAKESEDRDGKKRSREAYINKKNSEEHKTHMGIHEEKEYKAHSVSVQLKHPAYEGVTRKVVKVNATSTKHAEDIVATHYGRRGFKVHKIDYSKLHKEQFPKNAQEKAADEEKKEDNKVKKIAKAVKEAIK